MISKFGMLTEDVRIQVGSRSYHNLEHYTPNCRYSPSIYGTFNSFIPDFFTYDKAGKPVAAKFMPAFAGIGVAPGTAGVGNATRRINIPISRIREEISELEKALYQAIDDNSNVTTIDEGLIQLRINEPAYRIRELIKQRRAFLRMYVDKSEYDLSSTIKMSKFDKEIKPYKNTFNY